MFVNFDLQISGSTGRVRDRRSTVAIHLRWHEWRSCPSVVKLYKTAPTHARTSRISPHLRSYSIDHIDETNEIGSIVRWVSNDRDGRRRRWHPPLFTAETVSDVRRRNRNAHVIENPLTFDEGETGSGRGAIADLVGVRAAHGKLDVAMPSAEKDPSCVKQLY